MTWEKPVLKIGLVAIKNLAMKVFYQHRKIKNYNAEFKLKVLKTIKNKALSLSKAYLLFNIPSSTIIRHWHIRYIEESLTGLKPKADQSL